MQPLKRYRQRAGLSGPELARLSGVPHGSIKVYEMSGDTRRIKPEARFALAAVLKCAPSDLLPEKTK